MRARLSLVPFVFVAVLIVAATAAAQLQPSKSTGVLPLRPMKSQGAPRRMIGPLSMPVAPTGLAIESGEGGVFLDSAKDAEAWLAHGGIAIEAFGNNGAAIFGSSSASGLAYVGFGDYGIQASGNAVGGHFSNGIASGTADLADGDYGIQASGNTMGGLFQAGSSSGHAWVGHFDDGIDAYGNNVPGYFQNTASSGWAEVALGDYGIKANGNSAGGYFTTTSDYAFVASGTSKIIGNGSVSFVQNHPTDPGEVIVYAAPEGDEVATYTRGTARLVNGEAHVALGDTFKWVTNPDIGLTAQVTPRGDCKGVYVVSVSTDELVVRELGGGTSNTVFDYLVYGLRIGFEQSTIVQEKKRESYIPSMKIHRDLLARRPDLVKYTALARYSAQREALGIKEPLSLVRANRLVAAIHEFDPAVDKIDEGVQPQHQQPATSSAARPSAQTPAPAAAIERPGSNEPAAGIPSAVAPQNSEQLVTRMPVSSIVEPGDVLVVDRDHPDFFARGDRPADPTVVGVVAADAGQATGSAAVALSGVARCKVDASFGAIAPGDLLVSSPTPGYAMRSAVPLPGTVVGKALEGLTTGTGVIRILVTLR